MKSLLSGICIAFACAQTYAGEADVLNAEAICDNNICRFIVTFNHADEGWDHYVNQWQVLTMDDKVLGTRVIGHPHVHEQPITRSLSDVKIPPGTTQVRFRARDSVHVNGGREFILKLK